ncbi:anti-sigma factor [Microbacterium immunditiarum]|nr:anti-sigma factor [Microbacterium immunditiarum]
MSHLDPERMTLLAIGEPATDDERAHLAGCDQCALDLAQLEYTVAVGRSTATLGDLEAPPERVWRGIVDELGLTGSGAQADESSRMPPPAPSADEPPAPERPRRGIRILYALAASVAVILVAVGTWAFVQQATPTQIAAATLDAFPAHPTAVGEAVVVEEADGTREVRVTLDAAEAEDGFREVWLITADASALVSLGVMEGDEAVFTVPRDVDLHEYVLVDVSLEPEDGDPAHSGDSIVRGELNFA